MRNVNEIISKTFESLLLGFTEDTAKISDWTICAVRDAISPLANIELEIDLVRESIEI